MVWENVSNCMFWFCLATVNIEEMSRAPMMYGRKCT
jgi:hypothetical protein